MTDPTTPPKPAAPKLSDGEIIREMRRLGDNEAGLFESNPVEIFAYKVADRLEALAAERDRLRGLLDRVIADLGPQKPTLQSLELFQDIKAALAADGDDNG